MHGKGTAYRRNSVGLVSSAEDCTPALSKAHYFCFFPEKAFFTASTEFDRESFGLTWNQPLAGGGVLVGKKVRVELEIQATPSAI